MRNLRCSFIIQWAFCVSVLFCIGNLQVASAGTVCLPGDEVDSYPTEQHLYFDLHTYDDANVNDAKTIRARLSGSKKPAAKLKVYPKQGEKKQSLLTVTVVPLISTDSDTNELIASLDVPDMKISPLLEGPQFEDMKNKVEEALLGWEKRLTLEQKNEIHK